MMEQAIARRCFVHVGGYDPMPAEAVHRRFSRELRRFERTWSVSATTYALAVEPDEARWSVEVFAPNWGSRTDVMLLRWDDVMERAARAPLWRRLPRGIAATLDFVAGGALWGYLRRAWRYALFFLYPVVLMAMLVAMSVGLGVVIGRATGWTSLGWIAGILAVAGLFAWASRALLLSHLLDDWIFSRDLVRRPDPILSARLDRIAERLIDVVAHGRYDEVVVLGHSLGAVLAVDLVDRMLARRPDLLAAGLPVALVTVGSSIPKIGLHRGAAHLRGALGRVAASGITWVEYQALTDAMNFYKTDPVVALGAGPTGPILRTVRMSRMLEPAYYRTIKRNFFRVHNQFVSGNDRRAGYDYFMFACGPLPAATLAASRTGAVDRIGPDGTLLHPAAADGPPPS